MSVSEDLYKELILEHYQNPSHCGHLSERSTLQEGVNRSCGDEVKVEILVRDGVIRDIRVNSRGCSLSVASGSMMADAVEGMSVKQAEGLIENFKAMILEGRDLNLPPALEELGLEAFQGVRKYPIRVKCATLVWSTLKEALKNCAAAK